MSELCNPQVGVVVYAFGADPGNPINRSLADITASYYDSSDTKQMIAAQDEVAKNLKDRIPPEHLLPVGTDHSDYLNTADIGIGGAYQAAELLRVIAWLLKPYIRIARLYGQGGLHRVSISQGLVFSPTCHEDTLLRIRKSM